MRPNTSPDKPRAIMLFRRDLRTYDNTALIAALDTHQVLPVFILDPRQIASHPFRSEFGLQFLAQAVSHLSREFQSRYNTPLLVLHGKAEEVLEILLKNFTASAVFINRDYTPFSRTRDQAIKDLCCRLNIEFRQYADALLVEPERNLKSDRTPYTVFTPYFKSAQRLLIPPPRNLPRDPNLIRQLDMSLPDQINGLPILEKLLKISPSSPLQSPSIQPFTDPAPETVAKLVARSNTLRNYSAERDNPAIQSTSGLSAHLKFGTVSARALQHAWSRELGTAAPLIRQLHWRDFFYQIAFHFPHVFGAPFHRVYTELKWDTDQSKFQAWCNGETGFPIVDAGMRQLNSTGYMHNRVRMIVASFLTKDLHIDWREGERYFATKLIDYDPCVNNGSWQWSASTGCDAQPYFRIFNPWLQQQKFDPNCEYIKRWVPELECAPADQIHHLDEPLAPPIGRYRRPIVDHKVEKIVAEERFSDVRAAAAKK